MKNTLSIIFIWIFSLSAFAQIEISAETAEKQKLKKTENEYGKYDTEVFAYTNWSATNRTLVENVGLFGDTLGERANETGLERWSYGIGLRNRINNFLSWEGGLSLIRNGEQYRFEGIDSLSRYTTTYTYVGMPIKLIFNYGKKLQLISSVGIIPQMFMRYRQEGLIVDSDETELPFDNTFSSGFNSFVISAVFNLGVQYSVHERVKLFAIPEYRLQLSSSYTDKDPYIHKGRAIGVSVGFSVGL